MVIDGADFPVVGYSEVAAQKPASRVKFYLTFFMLSLRRKMTAADNASATMLAIPTAEERSTVARLVLIHLKKSSDNARHENCDDDEHKSH